MKTLRKGSALVSNLSVLNIHTYISLNTFCVKSTWLPNRVYHTMHVDSCPEPGPGLPTSYFVAPFLCSVCE